MKISVNFGDKSYLKYLYKTVIIKYITGSHVDLWSKDFISDFFFFK